MTQGKTPEQVNQMIQNLANERGVGQDQIAQWTQQFQAMGFK